MIHIRDATEADLPALVALLADDGLGQGREEPGPPLHAAYTDGFRRMLAQGGRILLLLDGTEPLGCLQLNILHGVSATGTTRAHIEAVRVRSDRRGQRLGHRLMSEAIRLAREADCRLVQLTTNLSRTDARRFYLGLGFVESHAGMKLTL